ncbi:MAG: HipA domain-containing protein [Alphaproteobacteria bacterium]|nr:HipA domain-containing protein [Alphaproteobacteria bacterium]
MMVDVSVLDVLLYGEPIGTLTRVGGDRILFAFNDSYIADNNRPVLGLGFKDQFGELITGFKPTQTRVIPFFANLLPEGHMRTYLAERAGVNPGREFFLLWVLGRDLPGAITIKPADGEAWPEDVDDHDDHGDNHHENALRFSLAGVQLKFSAINEASGGLTIPAKGVGGSWIVKLPSREFQGVPENEFSMMTLARLVGIDVPPVHLIDINEIRNLPEGIGTLSGQAFAIERFDRLPGGEAVHIEDLAQVFGVYPEQKYKNASARNIAAVIGAEGREADIAEFVRRLTFNTLIGNADMHLKNWSLIYPDRRQAALSPAYDFVSTIPYIPDRNAALNFSRTKRFDEYSQDELSHLAAKARLPEKLVLDTARETVERFHEQWQREKANLPLSAIVIDAIEEQLKIVPIAEAKG